ncbi:NUDIX hydrolase [Microgenomates group bacterium]|nr:NUDIX hydrolase [Microgenomates group bacterium]
MITCYFEKTKKKSFLRHVVVDILVIDGHKILLVKRAGKWLETGKWAMPGGFLDHDETGAQAAVRETSKETGYEAKVIKLFQVNDNPNRPHEDRQNVSLVYLMKPIKKVNGHDVEVSETRWFDLDNLPPAKSFAFDHLDTIKLYKFTLQKRFRLPFVNMTHEDVESWEETLDIMSNPKLVADIKRSQEEIKQGKVIPLEKVLKDLGLTENDLKKEKYRQGVYK